MELPRSQPFAANVLLFVCTFVLLGSPPRCYADANEPGTPGAISDTVVVRSMRGVSEYRLPNGLTLLLAPNTLQRRTYVNMVVRAGSAYEGAGEGGMAHLLEHMLFKGTPSTHDPMREFVEHGLSVNADTSVDRTSFYASFLPSAANLNWYLGWQADALINSTISKSDLGREMPVVRNEFERAASSPAVGMSQELMALAFPNHGYGRPTIGNRADIENVPIERLHAFYRTWYRPDNVVLVVAGKFDQAAALQRVREVFGRIPRPPTPMHAYYTREPIQDGPRGATIRRVGDEPMLLVGWRGVPASHQDDATLDVIAHVLAHGSGGRVEQEINAEKLGTQVRAGHQSRMQYGTFLVSARAADPSKLSLIENLVQSKIDEISAHGITEAELVQAKTAILADAAAKVHDPQTLGRSLAEAAGSGDWRIFFWHQDQVQDVNLASVQRAAQSFLLSENRVRVAYEPVERPQRAVDAVPGDLGDYVAVARANADAQTHANSASKTMEWFEPTPEAIEMHAVRYELPGGVHVVLLPRPTDGGFMSGTLRLLWGTESSMRGQRALANAVAANLLRGTARRSRDQFVTDLKALDSTIFVVSGYGGMTVNFRTTRQAWPAFSRILKEVLREPALSDASFAQWQQEQLAALSASQSDPVQQARRSVLRAPRPYDSDDPRYIPTIGEEIALTKALRPEQLRLFWKRFAGAGAGEFAAVGSMDPAQIQADVAGVLAEWASAEPYQRIALQRHEVQTTRQVVAAPDKANANFLSTHSLVLRAYSRDFYAAQIANALIGGGTASRIFTRLRKESGLTYDVSSSFAAVEDDDLAWFNVSGTFAPQNRQLFEETLAAVASEIASQGFTKLELSTAKRLAAGRAMAARLSDAELAAILANNARRNRTFSFQAEQEKLIQDLTLDEVNSAAARLLAPQGVFKILVGNFDGRS